MAEVFAYRTWESLQHTYVNASHKRTAEGIIACGGEIIRGSEEDVPDDTVDDQGYYIRPRRAAMPTGPKGKPRTPGAASATDLAAPIHDVRRSARALNGGY